MRMRPGLRPVDCLFAKAVGVLSRGVRFVRRHAGGRRPPEVGLRRPAFQTWAKSSLIKRADRSDDTGTQPPTRRAGRGKLKLFSTAVSRLLAVDLPGYGLCPRAQERGRSMDPADVSHYLRGTPPIYAGPILLGRTAPPRPEKPADLDTPRPARQGGGCPYQIVLTKMRQDQNRRRSIRSWSATAVAIGKRPAAHPENHRHLVPMAARGLDHPAGRDRCPGRLGIGPAFPMVKQPPMRNRPSQGSGSAPSWPFCPTTGKSRYRPLLLAEGTFQ